MTEPAKKNQLKKKKLRRKKERKEVNHPVCQCFLCWLNSWILLVKEHRHCLTGLNPGAQQAGDSSPPVVTFAAEERREGDAPPAPCGVGFWPKAQVGYPEVSVQLPVLAMSTEILVPLEEGPRASHCPVASCCSSRSQGAVVLQATFGKGCGRVTAVLASNGDQVKVVTLLHEYLSPKQRPWSFLLPRFSVRVIPAQLTITWERGADRETDLPGWLQLCEREVWVWGAVSKSFTTSFS